MSRKEAIAKLTELAKSKDIESAHGEADDVLCELLVALGYEDVVGLYREVPKWCA